MALVLMALYGVALLEGLAFRPRLAAHHPLPCLGQFTQPAYPFVALGLGWRFDAPQ
jgi:hypothetical protein